MRWRGSDRGKGEELKEMDNERGRGAKEGENGRVMRGGKRGKSKS